MESVQKVEHELAEEDNASKVKRSTNQASNVNKRDSPAPSKRLMCVEIASLLVVMIVIWFSLALPVVFFYLPVDDLVLPEVCTNSSTCKSGSNISGNGSESGSGSGSDSGSGGMSGQMIQGVGLSNNSAIVCSEDFFRLDGVGPCVAECPSWRQYSASTSVLTDTVTLVCGCIGFISACSVLIISCLRRKTILSFPSIFIVYLTATQLLLVTGIVVNFTDREALFCKSKSLPVSILNPTNFCIMAGILFYYCLLQLTLWWFFHLVALFWSARFPFSFRAMKKLKRAKYIHITCIILGLVLPVIPVVVTMADYATDERVEGKDSKGLGFGMTNFPPILCAGLDADATFYSLILPITLLTEIGMTLLVFTFWDVRKVHIHRIYMLNKNKKRLFRLGSGEGKIVIVLIYYVFLVEFALMAFTLATRNIEQFRTAIGLNFLCESQGYKPNKPCDRDQLESLKYPGVNLTAYVLLTLFPVINFTYVINFRKSKRWLLGQKMESVRVHSASGSYNSTVLRKFNSQNHSVPDTKLDDTAHGTNGNCA